MSLTPVACNFLCSNRYAMHRCNDSEPSQDIRSQAAKRFGNSSIAKQAAEQVRMMHLCNRFRWFLHEPVLSLHVIAGSKGIIWQTQPISEYTSSAWISFVRSHSQYHGAHSFKGIAQA